MPQWNRLKQRVKQIFPIYDGGICLVPGIEHDTTPIVRQIVRYNPWEHPCHIKRAFRPLRNLTESTNFKQILGKRSRKREMQIWLRVRRRILSQPLIFNARCCAASARNGARQPALVWFGGTVGYGVTLSQGSDWLRNKWVSSKTVF